MIFFDGGDFDLDESAFLEERTLNCLAYGFDQGEAHSLASMLEEEVWGAGVNAISVTHEMLERRVQEVFCNEEEEQAFDPADATGQSRQPHKMLFVLENLDQDFLNQITVTIDAMGASPVLVNASPQNLIDSSMTLAQLYNWSLNDYIEKYQLMEEIETDPLCEWEPSSAKVTLQAALDGQAVAPGGGGGLGGGAAAAAAGAAAAAAAGAAPLRWDTSKLVVLDGFLGPGAALTRRLLALVAEEGHDHTRGPCPKHWQRALSDVVAAEEGEGEGEGAPTGTWGLAPGALERLCRERHPALVEVQTRLARLYPQYTIARLSPQVYGEHLAPLVFNAPVAGDHYDWHIDADPNQAPPSTWSDLHGHYINRQPGKPLFVTLLLYLPPPPAEDEDENSESADGSAWEWPLNQDAETLFLDIPTDTGIFVRPKPSRAIIMDQDITHRVSAPSRFSKTPRYSLVWKLVFHPKQNIDGENRIVDHSNNDAADSLMSIIMDPVPVTLYGSANDNLP